MSFWDHLEELRWTLFRSILALFVFAIAGFSVMPWLFDNVVMAPCSSDFIVYREMCKISSHFSFLPDFCNDTFHVNIVNIKLASQFFTHMTSSFWLALLLTFPYLMWEIWKFVSPALYENEKKNVRWVFLFGTIMFFIGCSVGYFLVFPMTLRFLATYEMPLVSWLLSQIGLLNRSFFHKYRRHAVVGLLVGAAFITPSSDPFTLSIVFLPLYGLYELSAFFVKKAPKEEDEENEEDNNEE